MSAAAETWYEPLRRAQVRLTMLDSGVATILTLTASLRSGSAALRAAAAWSLQETGDARAIPPLMDALRDAEESVRRAAAIALGALHWQAPTEEEHAAHLVALGRWEAAVNHGSSSVDALLLAAGKSSPTTQARAIEALAALKSVRALLPLQELLKAPHALVRRAAALALKALEWVPVTDAQAIAQAIELEDWRHATSIGVEAVAPLMAALKSAQGQTDRSTAIADALAGTTDAKAANSLVAYCRDGEVAATAVCALSGLLDQCASEISAGTLAEIGTLNNVVQFQFAFDTQYQRSVRTGMEIVNVDALRAGASAELSRRTDVSGADEKSTA
jgi:HEAT repeat protein